MKRDATSLPSQVNAVTVSFSTGVGEGVDVFVSPIVFLHVGKSLSCTVIVAFHSLKSTIRSPFPVRVSVHCVKLRGFHGELIESLSAQFSLYSDVMILCCFGILFTLYVVLSHAHVGSVACVIII